MSHKCHAFDCGARVPPRMFMCRRHWYMLTKRERAAVWRHYRPGQEEGGGITDQYAEVAKACVQAIAEREGKIIPDDAPELLVYDMTIRAPESAGDTDE